MPKPGIHSQHANLLLEDPTLWESSWTDENHSLYIKYIEDAFVSVLYQKGNYTYPCKRWQAYRGEIASVFGLDLNEEVEFGQVLFGFPEESQRESEPEKPSLYHDVQNHSKKYGLKEICSSNDTSREQDRNGRRNKRKLYHGATDPEREIAVVFEEVQSKHNDERASNFYAERNRLTEDTTVSETSVKTLSNNEEDQVISSNNERSPKEDGKA
ncbi:hypothetical protein SUGI_0065350 [Cryptomeria japonica]|uniref:uncharacterized protein LOC131044981 n=1 Tax=Cryptomeria japonica TaxID=3369 RepID=UPI002408954B|nr:uncharacterized protein LOC131044981 [Cryptomeria japonica]GLJ07364.1 hypothetical protein SUGI_0065350 [Cryptomeria japonica]